MIFRFDVLGGVSCHFGIDLPGWRESDEKSRTNDLDQLINNIYDSVDLSKTP